MHLRCNGNIMIGRTNMFSNNVHTDVIYECKRNTKEVCEKWDTGGFIAVKMNVRMSGKSIHVYAHA